jgi:hypothetical protein
MFLVVKIFCRLEALLRVAPCFGFLPLQVVLAPSVAPEHVEGKRLSKSADIGAAVPA